MSSLGLHSILGGLETYADCVERKEQIGLHSILGGLETPSLRISARWVACLHSILGGLETTSCKIRQDDFSCLHSILGGLETKRLDERGILGVVFTFHFGWIRNEVPSAPQAPTSTVYIPFWVD